MKTIEDYLRLPYRIVLTHDEDEDGNEGFVAEVEELPGVYSQGKTPAEAVEGVFDAMQGWLSVALQDNIEIPEPLNRDDYSGRILLRLPRTLHGELLRQAEREGVSLNQFLLAVLASAVNWRKRKASA